jgi:dTDP-4-dehydrorhamnose reductase
VKVLLSGAAGQLGQALRQQVPEGVELIASSRSGGEGVMALDLADAQACRAAVRLHRPDWVLNGGAYTAVDRAESEPDLALAVNGGAPRAFAAGSLAWRSCMSCARPSIFMATMKRGRRRSPTAATR